jgi:hypothetical protein
VVIAVVVAGAKASVLDWLPCESYVSWFVDSINAVNIGKF